MSFINYRFLFFKSKVQFFSLETNKTPVKRYYNSRSNRFSILSETVSLNSHIFSQLLHYPFCLESFRTLKNLTRETYVRVMFSIYPRMVRCTSNLHSPNRPSCITHAKLQRDARFLAHKLLLNYSNTKYLIGVYIYIYLFILNLFSLNLKLLTEQLVGVLNTVCPHAITKQRVPRKRRVWGENEKGKRRMLQSEVHIHDNIFFVSVKIHAHSAMQNAKNTMWCEKYGKMQRCTLVFMFFSFYVS